jgi:spore coat protein H
MRELIRRWWLLAGTVLAILYLLHTDRWALVDRRVRPAPPPPAAIASLRPVPASIAARPTPVPALEPAGKSEKAAPGQRRPDPVGARPRVESDRLFAGQRVLRIEIEIPPEGEEALRGWYWRRGAVTRPQARATVREGGHVYREVAVHLKGSAGSFRSIDDQPALTLKFDKFIPGQRFHGLKQLSLNNSLQDPSYLSEKICRELFTAAGVPAPRAAHALLQLNGRSLGLYVLLEGYNKQFLKRHFSNASGNLFDGGFVQDVSEYLSVNCGDNREDHAALSRLIEAASEPDEARRLAKLEEALDVERFLKFVALEALTCHWDGYTMNRNNYRVFHDLDSDRLMFLPHGLDQVFGVGRGSTSQPILPRARGMVAAAILESDAGRQRYLETLAGLFRRVFDVDRILRRVDEVSQPVRAALAESQPDRVQYFVDRVQDFKDSIRERIRNVESQLAGGFASATARTSLSVNVPPGSWRPGTEAGDDRVAEEAGADGRPCLVVRGGPDGAAATWRATMVLRPGRYRVEGRVRCREVEGEGGQGEEGACLRVEGWSASRRLTGTSGFSTLAQSFRVGPGGPSEVEIVCELRSKAGEAWFDKQSLRIVREDDNRGWRGR